MLRIILAIALFCAGCVCLQRASADGLSAPIAIAPIGRSGAALRFPPVSGGGSPTWTQTDSQLNNACSNPCTQTVNATAGFNVWAIGGYLGGSATAVVGSVSVNGSALSLVSGATTGNYDTGYDLEIWAGTVATGGSVTLSAVTSPSGNWSRMYVGGGVLTNLSSSTATSTCNGTDLAASATVACSATVTVPSGGFAICGGLESFTTAVTSTNLTIDGQTSSASMTGAIAHALAASGTFTPQFTMPSFTNNGIACATWH